MKVKNAFYFRGVRERTPFSLVYRNVLYKKVYLLTGDKNSVCKIKQIIPLKSILSEKNLIQSQK